MRYTLLPLLLFAFARVMAAQTAFERVLIPVAIHEPVPGAYGSLWKTELVARNLGTSPMRIRQIAPVCPPIGASCGSEAEVGPRETVRLSPEGAWERRAAIIEVAPAEDVELQLRVQDISRRATTWGTAVPVVREQELRSGTIALLNVPVGEGFRDTLRLYAMDATAGAEMRVRVYSTGPNEAGPGVNPRPDDLLGERTFQLIAPAVAEREPFYLEIGDLNLVAPVGSAERVTIEVEPATPGLRFWAFISVTHNSTQHVTVLTPQ